MTDQRWTSMMVVFLIFFIVKHWKVLFDICVQKFSNKLIKLKEILILQKDLWCSEKAHRQSKTTIIY